MTKEEIIAQLCELSDEAAAAGIPEISDALDLVVEAEGQNQLSELIPLMGIYSQGQRVKAAFRNVACEISPY